MAFIVLIEKSIFWHPQKLETLMPSSTHAHISDLQQNMPGGHHVVYTTHTLRPLIHDCSPGCEDDCGRDLR